MGRRILKWLAWGIGWSLTWIISISLIILIYNLATENPDRLAELIQSWRFWGMLAVISTALLTAFLLVRWSKISLINSFITWVLSWNRWTKRLALSAMTYLLVGIILIWFWWVMIEKPRVMHLDLQKACEKWASKSHFNKFETCYWDGILQKYRRWY